MNITNAYHFNIFSKMSSLPNFLRLMVEKSPLANDGYNAKTKDCSVLAVASSSKKVVKKDKKKNKLVKTQSSLKGKSGGSTSKGSMKNSPSSDTECFYCHEKGHFKMNCPKYKRDLDGGKVEKKRHKGILVIELNLNIATSIQDWVCDTGSCAHLVANVQALKNRRSLRKGDVVLKVGN